MENIYEKVIKASLFGALFYICLYILPPLKERVVKKIESWLEKHGLFKYYKTLYRVIKAFLYVVLVLMILIPALFFLMVFFTN